MLTTAVGPNTDIAGVMNDKLFSSMDNNINNLTLPFRSLNIPTASKQTMMRLVCFRMFWYRCVVSIM